MRGRRSAIFILFLFLGTLLVSLAGTVCAAQEGEYSYEVIDNTATISKYTGPGGPVTIPAMLGGYPTVAIGDWAFERANLSSVIIPDSVALIGQYAFWSCANLTSVAMGGGVISIGDGAFGSCTSLASLTIGSAVTSIGLGAFYSCTNLTSVEIPNRVDFLGDMAFDGCSSLASVTISDNVTAIGRWAFSTCTSLTSVTIPGNVTTIGEGAFYACDSLVSVTIPGSVVSIGKLAFAFCYSPMSIYFLGSVAPSNVGADWNIGRSGMTGHAYAASNFPAPGDTWNELIMGDRIPGGPEPAITDDNAILITAAIIAIAGSLALILIYVRKKR